MFKFFFCGKVAEFMGLDSLPSSGSVSGNQNTTIQSNTAINEGNEEETQNASTENSSRNLKSDLSKLPIQNGDTIKTGESLTIDLEDFFTAGSGEAKESTQLDDYNDLSEIDIIIHYKGQSGTLFSVLANTNLGIRSVEKNLSELFSLYEANRLQRLFKLQLPYALPFILTGMKTSIGLALIGSVVAEFVAGSGTSTGLAWRIIEAGNRLDVPKLFAALILLVVLGVFLFLIMSLLEKILLKRWDLDKS